MRLAAWVFMGVIASMLSATFVVAESTEESAASLQRATDLLEAGEIYLSKKMTRELLKQSPDDSELQYLMARIIDQEVMRERDVFEGAVPEDLSGAEKDAEAKTWLERSKSLLEIEMYEQAYSAAEKVFLYDPDNREASELLDRIKSRAFKSGKGQMIGLEKARQENIRQRITDYRKQAENWLNQGRLGAARLAIEKILILSPEDPDGLELRKQLDKTKDEHPE